MAAVGKRKLDEVVESAVAILPQAKKAKDGEGNAAPGNALVPSMKAGGALIPAVCVC